MLGDASCSFPSISPTTYLLLRILSPRFLELSEHQWYTLWPGLKASMVFRCMSPPKVIAAKLLVTFMTWDDLGDIRRGHWWQFSSLPVTRCLPFALMGGGGSWEPLLPPFFPDYQKTAGTPYHTSFPHISSRKLIPLLYLCIYRPKRVSNNSSSVGLWSIPDQLTPVGLEFIQLVIPDQLNYSRPPDQLNNSFRKRIIRIAFWSVNT